MPIYAYRCASCGHQKDVLQKLSDSPLTKCPECGNETFSKQVTAAGFQLKGSGWYVTDFRGGNNGGAKAASDGAAAKVDSGTEKSEGASSGTDSPAKAGSGDSAGSTGTASTESSSTVSASTASTGAASSSGTA